LNELRPKFVLVQPKIRVKETNSNSLRCVALRCVALRCVALRQINEINNTQLLIHLRMDRCFVQMPGEMAISSGPR